MDNFLKTQIWLGIPINISWAFIIPLVAKLHGELWSVAAISCYFVGLQLAGLIIPLFTIDMKSSYLGMVILNFTYLMASGLYFIDPNIYLLVELALNMSLVTLVALYEISFSVMLADKYSPPVIREYETYSHVRESFGSLIGFIVAGLLYNYLSFEQSMATFMVVMLPTSCLGVWNYKKYIANIYSNKE